MNHPLVSVGSIAPFLYGKALKSGDRVQGGVAVFGSGGQVGFHDHALTEEPAIVIGRKGSIGSVWYSDGPSWTIDTAYYVPQSATQVDLRWLYWALQQLGLKEMNKSAAIPGLNRDDVARLQLPLPPLPEQRRIAAILDEADALRTKRRAALELLDEVEDRIVERYARDASLVVFDELVLGFKYGTSVKSGPVGQTVLRIPNIGARGLVLDDLKYVDLARGEQERLALGSGDVLFVRSNGNPEMIGRCAAFDSRIADRDQPVVYASYLIRARLKPGLDAPALAAMMRTPIVRRQMHAAAATSAGQYNINIKSLGALQVPGLSAGAAAALSADLNELQRERERHQAGLVSLDTFFASLQHRAFTGRL